MVSRSLPSSWLQAEDLQLTAHAPRDNTPKHARLDYCPQAAHRGRLCPRRSSAASQRLLGLNSLALAQEIQLINSDLLPSASLPFHLSASYVQGWRHPW